MVQPVTRNQQLLLPVILFSIAILLLDCSPAYSQLKIDSLFTKIDPERWSASIEKRVSKLEDKIIAGSRKTLQRLQKQEEKIYRRMLTTKDSLQAEAALADIENKYKTLQDKLKNPAIPGAAKQYIPKLDTLTTALKFLDQNGMAGNIKEALAKTESLQCRLQQAEEIKNFIRQRKQQLKDQLERLGLVKQLKKFNKQAYYYITQLKEYKETLSDSKKRDKKVIELLSKTRLFKDFMRKNSMLASLFRQPGDPQDPLSQAGLAGLQTRTQVNSLIQQQIAAGGPNAQVQFQQGIQNAQNQINQLKNKISQGGGSSSDDIMPENFRPNNQRVKNFWQKWELGINVQSNRSNGVLPVSSDLGISAGFKPRDNFIAGIGFSGRIGWGKDIRHIAMSYQGISARTFTELKLKGSFHAVAGYEMNYRSEIHAIEQLRNYSAWARSGLVGLSKTVSVKSKFFKKTKFQLLWDFLSYQQIPKTQPMIFRIGYTL